MHSLFSGLSGAQMPETRGEFMLPGSFDLSISRVLCRDTRKSGVSVICEFDVAVSNVPTQGPGKLVTWIQKMADKAMAFRHLKGFIASVLGYSSADAERLTTELTPIIENLALHMVGANNPFRGLMVHCDTHVIQTKPPNVHDFTVHTFSPFDYLAHGLQAPDMSQMLALGQTPAQEPYLPPPQNYPQYAAGGQSLPAGGYPQYQAPPPAMPGYAPAMPPHIHRPAPPMPPGPAQMSQYAPPPPPSPVGQRQLSPDGRYWLDPRSNTWQPV